MNSRQFIKFGSYVSIVLFVLFNVINPINNSRQYRRHASTELTDQPIFGQRIKKLETPSSSSISMAMSASKIKPIVFKNFIKNIDNDDNNKKPNNIINNQSQTSISIELNPSINTTSTTTPKSLMSIIDQKHNNNIIKTNNSQEHDDEDDHHQTEVTATAAAATGNVFFRRKALFRNLNNSEQNENLLKKEQNFSDNQQQQPQNDNNEKSNNNKNSDNGLNQNTFENVDVVHENNDNNDNDDEDDVVEDVDSDVLDEDNNNNVNNNDNNSNNDATTNKSTAIVADTSNLDDHSTAESMHSNKYVVAYDHPYPQLLQNKISRRPQLVDNLLAMSNELPPLTAALPMEYLHDPAPISASYPKPEPEPQLHHHQQLVQPLVHPVPEPQPQPQPLLHVATLMDQPTLAAVEHSSHPHQHHKIPPQLFENIIQGLQQHQSPEAHLIENVGHVIPTPEHVEHASIIANHLEQHRQQPQLHNPHDNPVVVAHPVQLEQSIPIALDHAIPVHLDHHHSPELEHHHYGSAIGLGQHHLYDPTDYIPGIPGKPWKDYPIFSSVPKTSFQCNGHYGYFADIEAGCQVWHYCQPDGRHDSFLCSNGTLFNQKTRVCDWWHNVDCKQSINHYDINNDLYKIDHHLHSIDGYGSTAQALVHHLQLIKKKK